MSQFPPFSIISPRTQWINSDGTPTPEFFRLILNILNAGGAGQFSVVDLLTIVAGTPTPPPPDLPDLLDMPAVDDIARITASDALTIIATMPFDLASDGTVTSVVSTTTQLVISPTVGGVSASLQIGTSGAVLPLLNGANTWSANQVFSSNVTISGSETVTGNVTVGGDAAVSGSLVSNTFATNGLNCTNFNSSNATVTGTLHVTGNSTVSGTLNIQNNTTINGALVVTTNVAADGMVMTTQLVPATDNTIPCGSALKRFTDIFAVSGSVNPSDISLKSAPRALPPSLPIVEAVMPIMWEWDKEEWRDGRTHWGFDAQEIAVEVAKTGVDWGGHLIDETGTHNLRYHETIAILWQAVRELSAEVTALKGAAA